MKKIFLIASFIALSMGIFACSKNPDLTEAQSKADFDDQTLYEMGYAIKHITPVTPELSEMTMDLLLASAEMGNAEAMVQIGEMYMADRVALEAGQNAAEEAVRWWEKSWENGSTRGYHNIGLMYYNVAVPGTGGNGGDVYDLNYDEGFKYFKAASDKGDTKAHRFVGHSYENGWGTEQDYAKAAEYYRINGPVILIWPTCCLKAMVWSKTWLSLSKCTNRFLLKIQVAVPIRTPLKNWRIFTKTGYMLKLIRIRL